MVYGRTRFVCMKKYNGIVIFCLGRAGLDTT